MLATDVEPVCGFDNAVLGNVGLTERFRELELEVRRVEAEMASVIVEGQRRGVYG
ncbi:MAG: hypothetical protein IZT58_11330, partial [Actinobacteria bacterium]|nr:hypothetical protein [Actinomycetota bacterium]